MQFKKMSSIIFSLLLLISIASCGGSVTTSDEGVKLYTGTAILSWGTPTMWTDNSMLTSSDIKGYRVYASMSPGIYVPGSYTFVSPSSTSIAVKDLNLPVGTYYFIVTVLDSAGIESDFSNELPADLY